MKNRIFVISAVIGSAAGFSPLTAQQPGGPCALDTPDFGACIEAVEAKQNAVALAKQEAAESQGSRSEIAAAEAQLSAAKLALSDLAARTAKLSEVERTLAAAQQRHDASQDEAITAYERLVIEEKREEAKALSQRLAIVRAGALRYASLALLVPLPRSSDQVPIARAKPSADRSAAIERPSVVLDVSTCASAAGQRAGRVIPGGEIKVPGSVLNPPGFTALLSGDETGGKVNLTFTTEVSSRGAAIMESGTASDPKVQTAARLGASIGMQSGDGTIFSRDTTLDGPDQLNNSAALTASLYANFFSAESKSSWDARAKALSSAAINACRADQQASKPSFVSSCTGQSLTDWVYAIGSDGKRLNAKVAEQADALYFRGASSIPRFGGGVNVEIARSSFEYTTPALFSSNFAGDFKDDNFKEAAFRRSSDWVASLSPFLYLRVTDADAKFGLSLIPSYTFAKTLSYANGYEKPFFCPVTDTDVPFTTAGCRRFYGQAPSPAEVETWSLEARSAFRTWGSIDLVAAPKVSWNDKDKTQDYPWLVSIPVLAFTDTDKTSAVGVKVDWQFGQEDSEGGAEDDSVIVKLVYQKAFSLTGK